MYKCVSPASMLSKFLLCQSVPQTVLWCEAGFQIWITVFKSVVLNKTFQDISFSAWSKEQQESVRLVGLLYTLRNYFMSIGTASSCVLINSTLFGDKLYVQFLQIQSELLWHSCLSIYFLFLYYIYTLPFHQKIAHNEVVYKLHFFI